MTNIHSKLEAIRSLSIPCYFLKLRRNFILRIQSCFLTANEHLQDSIWIMGYLKLKHNLYSMKLKIQLEFICTDWNIDYKFFIQIESQAKYCALQEGTKCFEVVQHIVGHNSEHPRDFKAIPFPVYPINLFMVIACICTCIYMKWSAQTVYEYARSLCT
jgi:hypothetical protein